MMFEDQSKAEIRFISKRETQSHPWSKLASWQLPWSVKIIPLCKGLSYARNLYLRTKHQARFSNCSLIHTIEVGTHTIHTQPLLCLPQLHGIIINDVHPLQSIRLIPSSRLIQPHSQHTNQDIHQLCCEEGQNCGVPSSQLFVCTPPPASTIFHTKGIKLRLDRARSRSLEIGLPYLRSTSPSTTPGIFFKNNQFTSSSLYLRLRSFSEVFLARERLIRQFGVCVTTELVGNWPRIVLSIWTGWTTYNRFEPCL